MMSGSLHDNRFTIEVEMDEGRLHNTLVSAIEGSYGCRHWARIDVGEHQPGWMNYFTARFTVLAGDSGLAQDGVQYELSLDRLKAGLKVLATEYPHHFKDILTQTGDAVTGDALVQCALFGDIVYV